jgi:hypothetical protein
VAQTAVPVTVNNLTPTFYVMCVAVVGLFGILVRQWVPYKKLLVEEDASLRADLLKRISELEAELSEERRRCDEKMSKLQAQFDGLQRMVIQWQVSSGRAFELGGSSEAAKTIPRVEEHLAKRGQE